MGKSRFIELMAKNIGKSATKEELEELAMFLEQFPEYQKMQNVTHSVKGNIKQSKNRIQEKDLNAGLEELWDKIKKTDEKAGDAIEERPVKYPFYWKLTAAAAILIVMFAGLFLYRIKTASTNGYATSILHRIDVPYGKTREIVLSDGTKVKLNAGSTFIYPESFSADRRAVTLKGEGFFEVTKNPRKPFLVLTKNLTIKVLGTVFNVKAYPEDKNIETTLLRGKVRVELKANPEKNIVLLPNEKLIVANDGVEIGNTNAAVKGEDKVAYQIKKLPKINAETIEETAWLSNRIVFTNENFEEVARQIERKYNVQIVFEDPALKTEQLSGALDKETLENALQIMKMTTPFKFRTEGRMIYIAHK